VFVAGFPADAFDTNCYVLAPGPGEQCVVVDPGIGVTARLDALFTEHRLDPVAVLLTHGHLDHTFSVTPVCDARDIPAYVHPGDRSMLADPAKGLSRDLRELFGGRFTWTEPPDVKELPDDGEITIAGLSITVDLAPGHTPGSVLFRLTTPAGSLRWQTPAPLTVPAGSLRWHTPAPLTRDEAPLCLSGDVLFAGSIGRTDLPGGDDRAMQISLRDKILPLADETVVLPGHGPATTIGRERAVNPFLREVLSGPAAPSRGW
jgi:glyoxylase-like metal-dependent hydrolase (beta-lactamase superfamily II)